MSRKTMAMAACFALYGAIGLAFAEEPKTQASAQPQGIEELTRGWPEASREAGAAMVAKYGPPDEATPTMLVWHDSGPWKRSILYKEEVKHTFPKPHTDVLEQFVDYKVPADLVDDLWRYDGSVIAERTKGEISARCDKEEMNYLALNLAHDIATGKRTADDARQFYASTAAAFMAGQTDSPYVKGLMFSPQRDAADPDQPLKPGA